MQIFIVVVAGAADAAINICQGFQFYFVILYFSSSFKFFQISCWFFGYEFYCSVV